MGAEMSRRNLSYIVVLLIFGCIGCSDKDASIEYLRQIGPATGRLNAALTRCYNAPLITLSEAIENLEVLRRDIALVSAPRLCINFRTKLLASTDANLALFQAVRHSSDDATIEALSVTVTDAFQDYQTARDLLLEELEISRSDWDNMKGEN